MRWFKGRLLTGCFLIACALAASLAYEWKVRGVSVHRGEMFGPVMYFRPFVHALTAVIGLVGAVVVFKARAPAPRWLRSDSSKTR